MLLARRIRSGLKGSNFSRTSSRIPSRWRPRRTYPQLEPLECRALLTSFEVVTLPGIDHVETIQDINDSGDFVGTYSNWEPNEEYEHAIVYDRGLFIYIDGSLVILSDLANVTAKINNNGHVIYNASFADNGESYSGSYLWVGGSITEISFPGSDPKSRGRHSSALTITDDNVVYGGVTGQSERYLYEDGEYALFTPPELGNGITVDVVDGFTPSGSFYGHMHYENEYFRQRIFYYDINEDEIYTSIDIENSYTFLRDANDRGQMIGFRSLWDRGAIVAIDSLPVLGLLGVNNATQIAGDYRDQEEYERNHRPGSPPPDTGIIINIGSGENAAIRIADTSDENDDITLLNPGFAQPIPARIAGPPGLYELSVEPPGAVSFSETTVELWADPDSGIVEPAEVTITPQVVSGAPNDVKIVLKRAGTDEEVAREDMTVVSVTQRDPGTGQDTRAFPLRIRRPTDPAELERDRIPPRVDTSISMLVTPDLSGSGQSVTLYVDGQSRETGTIAFLSDGGQEVATYDLTRSGDVYLRGLTQTEPYFANSDPSPWKFRFNPYASRLQLVAKVHGEDVVDANGFRLNSDGFSVAAIPIGVTVYKLADINNVERRSGLWAGIQFVPDSGGLTDLDAMQYGESLLGYPGTGVFERFRFFERKFNWIVERDPETGELAIPYDKHTIASPYLKSPGGVAQIHQVYEFRDARLGVSGIPIPNSGFRITHEVFSEGGIWRVETSKFGEAVRIGAIGSGPGSTNPEAGIINVVPPLPGNGSGGGGGRAASIDVASVPSTRPRGVDNTLGSRPITNKARKATYPANERCELRAPMSTQPPQDDSGPTPWFFWGRKFTKRRIIWQRVQPRLGGMQMVK